MKRSWARVAQQQFLRIFTASTHGAFIFVFVWVHVLVGHFFIITIFIFIIIVIDFVRVFVHSIFFFPSVSRIGSFLDGIGSRSVFSFTGALHDHHVCSFGSLVGPGRSFSCLHRIIHVFGVSFLPWSQITIHLSFHALLLDVATFGWCIHTSTRSCGRRRWSRSGWDNNPRTGLVSCHPRGRRIHGRRRTGATHVIGRDHARVIRGRTTVQMGGRDDTRVRA
mmetsp:Transcript_4878/g.31230  ORF Transcript_4878/g.31230 Transcript_4878/m.31230 type:complete len:222 (+) Transcript_4878:3879-4544(+)